jgi:hypothetical protein
MTDPTLAQVLDGHTAPIDPDWIGVACEECAVVVPAPDLADHMVTAHGHEAAANEARVELATTPDGHLTVEAYCGSCGHLDGCPACRAIGDDMAALITSLAETLGVGEPVDGQRRYRGADEAFSPPDKEDGS